MSYVISENLQQLKRTKVAKKQVGLRFAVEGHTVVQKKKFFFELLRLANLNDAKLLAVDFAKNIAYFNTLLFAA